MAKYVQSAWIRGCKYKASVNNLTILETKFVKQGGPQTFYTRQSTFTH